MKETTTATATGTSKCDRFREQNNNSASASRFFCTLLCRHCATTTWNDQIISLLWNGKGKAINSTISVWTRAQSLPSAPTQREETRSSAHIFACLWLTRHPTIWEPGTGYAKQFLLRDDLVENRRRANATKSAGTHRGSIIIISTVVTLNDDLWVGLL